MIVWQGLSALRAPELGRRWYVALNTRGGDQVRQVGLMHLVTDRFGSFLGLCALSALIGCNQILDIKDHPLAAGAAGRSVSSAGGASGKGAGGRAGSAGHAGSAGNVAHAGNGAGGSSGTSATSGGSGGDITSSGGTGGGSGGTDTMGEGGADESGAGGQAGTGATGGMGPVAMCGNGKIDGDDACDDGNTMSGDGCSATCTFEAGWTCNAQGCTEICGDGLVVGNEAKKSGYCDDGNTSASDGCSPTCAIEAGWTCNAQGCKEICGDGLTVGLEAKAGGCDDKNSVSNDGCTNCAVDPSYNCSGAPSVCAKTCGDGMIQGTEGCDDGNTMAGDGCFACAVEAGYTCDATKHPTTCADINECTAAGGSPCGSNSTCANTVGSYTCTCASGFASSDGKNCMDVNECTSSTPPCGTNSTCTNTAGAYMCACKSGYTSADGKNCTDVNECTSGTPCGTNSTCTNTAGAYTCACNSGFTSSDGKNCADVNECSSSPCGTNSTCANTSGSYTCTCNSGYSSSNGKNCSDINECTAGGNNCSTNATCANTTGSFTCTCNSGYMGNGVTCSACNCAGGYTCTTSACKTSCASDNDCVSDHFCSASACKVDAVQVSVSASHACMVLADGTVRCWGQNADRELGTSSSSNATTPTQVQSITTAKVVGAGNTQSVAVLANGSVVWWGKRPTDYDYGNFTTSYSSPTPTPTAISGLGGATDIVIAPNTDGATCVLINDKTVRCWGFTSAFDGTTNFLTQPTDVGVTGATTVAGGNSFNCASLATGAKCWGFGYEGELAASVNYAWSPPATTSLSGTVSKIRAGDYFGCALMSTGVVQCWGSNQYHQLGPRGGSDFDSPVPLVVDGLSSVKDLSGGAQNACAVDTSGGIKCWGDDTYAQLGDQNLGSMGSGAPVSVPGLAGPASSVATGFQNVCAVLQNGSVQCWGRSIGDLGSTLLTPTTVW